MPQPFDATLSTDAGLLEASERDAEVGSERVLAHRPGVELTGDVAVPVDVVGEHRGVEAEDGVIRDPDRVALVVGGDHAEDRAEDLLLGDGRRVVDIAEDRRLHEPAALQVLRPPATGGERRAFVDPLGDVALDAVSLALHRQRTHLRLLVERVADGHLPEAGRERVHHLVVALPGDDDAGE